MCQPPSPCEVKGYLYKRKREKNQGRIRLFLGRANIQWAFSLTPRNPRGSIEMDQFGKVVDLIKEVSLNSSAQMVVGVGKNKGVLGVETTSHLFFSCPMARKVVNLINRWWSLADVELETIFESKVPKKALFFDDVVAAEYRHVKVLEFFDCPGPRQGIEDLRELFHKGTQGDREVEVFQAEIGSTKSLLKREFDMKDLGEAKKILGMEIVRDHSRKILRVSQSGCISKILNNFRIDNGKSVQMPLGGHFKLSLKDYLIRDCDVEKMNIAYAVSIVSIYSANPGKNHWEAVKWNLKYLRGTANVGLIYGTNRGNHKDVTCFVDSDYAKDPDKGRSITGYAFLVQGCVVSWKTTLQHVVALLTTEAEYMALTEAMKEAIWPRRLLEELVVELNRVTVNCDNQGAIHLSRNHVFHERTKHINVRYHFIREFLEAKTVKVLKVGTEHNAADALTKVFENHTIGMKGGSHQSNGDNKRNTNNGSGGSFETSADDKKTSNEMMVWPPKFAIGLTNKEKEEDFLAIEGSKLPQRPKNTPSSSNELSIWFAPKPRGLKAIGGMESELE
nr:retrovirus-related Pol polyprotein from transposon TNT 1-94 [Tanacetum cinerariifolium]